MKKMIAALAVLFSLTITGCELLVSPKSDDSSESLKGAVHGRVILNAQVSLGSGSRLKIEVVTNASIEKAAARADVTTYTKYVSVSASGTYSYKVANLPNGDYRSRATLVDSNGNNMSNVGSWSGLITIADNDVEVADTSIDYSGNE